MKKIEYETPFAVFLRSWFWSWCGIQYSSYQALNFLTNGDQVLTRGFHGIPSPTPHIVTASHEGKKFLDLIWKTTCTIYRIQRWSMVILYNLHLTFPKVQWQSLQFSIFWLQDSSKPLWSQGVSLKLQERLGKTLRHHHFAPWPWLLQKCFEGPRPSAR